MLPEVDNEGRIRSMKKKNILPSFRFTSPRIVSGVFSYGSSANLKPKFSFTLVFADLILLVLLNG